MKNWTLNDIKDVQPHWFSRENKRFFGDHQYWLKWSGSGNPYLVRSTDAWTDMFGHQPRLHYRLNIINDDKTIGHLLDNEFSTMAEVRRWLRIS